MRVLLERTFGDAKIVIEKIEVPFLKTGLCCNGYSFLPKWFLMAFHHQRSKSYTRKYPPGKKKRILVQGRKFFPHCSLSLIGATPQVGGLATECGRQ